MLCAKKANIIAWACTSLPSTPNILHHHTDFREVQVNISAGNGICRDQSSLTVIHAPLFLSATKNANAIYPINQSKDSSFRKKNNNNNKNSLINSIVTLEYTAMRRIWKLLVHCLSHSAVQFYGKSSLLGFFLQVFGWSLGKPSREATDSLQMTGQSLRDTITELSVPEIELKRISKALTTSTVANENLARDLGVHN